MTKKYETSILQRGQDNLHPKLFCESFQDMFVPYFSDNIRRMKMTQNVSQRKFSMKVKKAVVNAPGTKIVENIV